MSRLITDRIEKGEFVISAQIDPPESITPNGLTETVRLLKNAGATDFDINSSRRISHDSIQLAMGLSQLEFPSIPHVTTRDSSLNGILNQVLAAYVWSAVRNFLIITGDPHDTSKSAFPSKGVFETDSIGTIRAIDAHLRRDPKFNLRLNLGAALNQNERDLEKEAVRAQEKIEAGADFFMSQPVFNKDQIRALSAFHRAHSNLPLVIGVWPLVSSRTIETIKNSKIVGVEIPDEVYNDAPLDRADEIHLTDWGLKNATELIRFIRESALGEGVYIVSPLRNPLVILDLLEEISK